MSFFTPPLRAQNDAPDAGFPSFDRKAREGESLNVVFLGGSLSWGSQASDPQLTSWRALISQRFQAEYPRARFRFWDAAIGGTGSQLAAFRLQRDVLSRKPDLVFLDFTINDDPYRKPDEHSLAAYESLVRRLVQVGIPVLEVILPAKKDVLPDPPARPLDSLHKQIAEAYRLPVADAVDAVKKAVAAEETTPDRLWDWLSDVTHPGDAGYALYADVVWSAYSRAVRAPESCRVPSAMLHDDAYTTVVRQSFASLPALPKGWRITEPSRTAIAVDFTPSRWLDKEVFADSTAAADPLILSVQGRHLFLLGEIGPRSGKLEVRIDGTPATYDPDGWAKDGNGRWFRSLAYDLDPTRRHRVEIVPHLETGQEFRLESLCVAGEPATAVPIR